MTDRYDEGSARCHVFTFKEGLLSPVAHDLRIAVTRFTVDVDEASGRVAARFDAGSLRVECAMQDGRPNEGALSPRDKAEIERTIAAEVLMVARFPTIEFSSTAVRDAGPGRRVLRGALALHGRTNEIEVEVARAGESYVGEAAIDQPAFGIKPYRAMLGALRLRPGVRVRITVPAARRSDGSATSSTDA